MSRTDAVKVLFLGNSHTYYNDMPLLFQEICRDRGKEVEVRMIAQSGVTYRWHLNHMIELRFELMYGGYDFLVMQQAAHGAPPTKEETHRDGHEIAEMARRFGTVPIQTVPWAEKKFPEHQAGMYEIFESFAEKENIRLNPVGRIFEEVSRSHPEINMYWTDGEHASPYGTYATALCAYAAIFGESVADVTVVHSRETYPLSQKGWERVQAAYAYASAHPEQPELEKEADKAWDRECPVVMDPKEAVVSLDPEKAKILRELTDRFVLGL